MRRNLKKWQIAAAFAAFAVGIRAAHADAEAVACAAELGITAESLVAADLHTYAQSILQSVEARPTERQALTALKADAAEKADEITALAHLMSASAPDESLQSQHAAAVADLAALREQIANMRTYLLGIVLTDLPSEKVARIAVWKSTLPHRLPGEFRVLEKTADEWKAIERALIAERRAARTGKPLAEEHAELLAAIRSNAAVIAAQQRLATSLASTAEIVEQFAEGEE